MSKSDMASAPRPTFVRNVDWNLFKVFYEIGRRGGVGAAARILNKQQPSVSAALQRLEAHLEAALCLRTSRGIALTVQGQQVFAACEAMYQAVQATANQAQTGLEGLSGTLSLRVISNLYLVGPLTEVFASFHRDHPNVEVRLDVAPWREVLRSVQNAEVELAIGFAESPDPRLLYVPIIEQKQQVYCGPNHRLYGQTVRPEDLVSEPFVLTHDEPSDYLRFRQAHGLGRQVGGVADNLHERMWLIQLGMGVGLLPKPVVDASTFAGALWPLLPEPDIPVCTIFLMASASPVRSAPAQLFLQAALASMLPV